MDNATPIEDNDPYAEVPAPKETDGPQESVDWTELEEEGHAVLPEEVENDEPEGS